MNNGIYGMPGQDVPRNPVPIGGMLAMAANYSGNLAYGSDNSVYLKSGVVTDAKNFPAAPAETVFKISPSFNTQSQIVSYSLGNAVAFGNGIFLRTSTSGATHISTDGLTWTAATILASAPQFTVFLNGFFWTGGQTSGSSAPLYYSADGISWNTINVNASTYSINGLAYNSITGAYVASTNNVGAVYVSTDNAVSWSAPSSAMGSLATNGVAYGNGLFVLISPSSSTYATSPDGSAWTARTMPYALSSQNRIYFVNGTFITGVSTTTILTSIDGLSWSIRTIPATTGNCGYGYGNGQYFVISSNYLVTSPDLVTWTTRTCPFGSYGGQAPTHWAFGNGTIIVFDGYGTVTAPAISVDGINFIQYGGDVSILPSGTLTGWTYGAGVYLATVPGSSFGLFRSTDGISWKCVTGVPAATYDRVSFSNGLFIMSAGVGSGKLLTSTDGLTWAYPTVANPGSAGWGKAAYGAGVWVCYPIVATMTNVLSSSDGVTWTSRNLPTSQIWNGIAFGAGKFIMTSTTSYTTYSVDGINWNPGAAIAADGILFGNGLFGIYKANSQTIRYSSDGGTTWGRATAPATVSSMEFNAGLFYINTNSGIYQSADLVSWLQISTDTSVNGFKMLPVNGSMALIATQNTGALAAVYGTIKRVANATAQFVSSSGSSTYVKGVQLYMRVQ